MMTKTMDMLLILASFLAVFCVQGISATAESDEENGASAVRIPTPKINISSIA